jgi:hypothetical protein
VKDGAGSASEVENLGVGVPGTVVRRLAKGISKELQCEAAAGDEPPIVALQLVHTAVFIGLHRAPDALFFLEGAT